MVALEIGAAGSLGSIPTSPAISETYFWISLTSVTDISGSAANATVEKAIHKARTNVINLEIFFMLFPPSNEFDKCHSLYTKLYNTRINVQ